MANINFFIPVEINALPEYLSSGFIGLLSSKDESVKDRQSLIFPNNLGLKNIESIQANLCIEVSFPEERCTFNDSVVQTYTPIPISKIKKIIFFILDIGIGVEVLTTELSRVHLSSGKETSMHKLV